MTSIITNPTHFKLIQDKAISLRLLGELPDTLRREYLSSEDLTVDGIKTFIINKRMVSIIDKVMDHFNSLTDIEDKRALLRCESHLPELQSLAIETNNIKLLSAIVGDGEAHRLLIIKHRYETHTAVPRSWITKQ